MATDFYELLEVSRQANEDEIKRAYRRLARQYHPDANPGDAASEARFKELTVAYETLRDPERRRRYDMFGPDGARGAGGPGAGAGANPFGDLGDLFDAFFGGDPFGGGRGPSGPARGPDAEVEITLTLAEAAFGVTRTIDARLASVCETCTGSGCVPGTFPARCTDCGGAGEVRQVRRSVLGQMVTSSPCRACSGTGQTIPSPCQHCGGDGRTLEDRHLEVEVPAGIDAEQRLRLTGRGHAAPRGGTPGDLYVVVDVAKHATLERHGRDLLHVEALGLAQLALGTHLEIESLDGVEEIDVPAGTPSGHLFRVRGKGVPQLRGRGRGDLIVQVDVDVPDDLSAEEDDLLRRYAELRGETVASKEHGIFRRIRSAFQ